MRSIHHTAAGAAILTCALIVLGAVVRTTNSGLACPDWPTCYGHWLPLPGDIPPTAGYAYHQVMLEWTHRLIAGFFLGPAILALGLLTFVRGRERPALPRLGALVLVLMIVQALLGGVTVLDRNSPWSVALHLGNALLLLSAILLIQQRSRDAVPAPRSARLITLATVTWLLATVAMVAAAMMAKSGASLACDTWPSCNGTLIPDLSDGGIRLNLTHRLLAAATVLAVLVLWLALRATPSAPDDARFLAGLVLVFIGLEVAMGGIVVASGLQPLVSILHQAWGTLTYAATALLLWRICWPMAAADATGTTEERPHGLALRGA